MDAPVTIHLCDIDTATAMRLAKTGDKTRVHGWLDVDRREIWCVDDPATVYHELRHLPEWDGAWHVTGFSGRQIDVSEGRTVAVTHPRRPGNTGVQSGAVLADGVEVVE